MRILRSLLVVSSLSMTTLAACGGGPCGKAIDNTAKFANGEEKKMAVEKRDDFVKVCEMGLKDPDMQKMTECMAKATDEKSFDDCHKM